ncbi:maleylacetate reductase [Paracoccus pacificus]|uniref:Maleylacetate reductase n=1 Tax=Paracoccus pacificus TaxID=1463598 RepID=A0ABW4R376_9RHOB
MRDFTYIGLPARVVFGSGTIARLPDEVGRLGIRRAMVLTTPHQEAEGREIAAMLGESAAHLFTGATMHTPVSVTEAALKLVRDQRIDGFVAIGGGSTTGLAKALALRTDLPQLIVPTTYAGSEMTPVVGETADGEKVTRSDPAILPETVIYDVDLTLGLPPAITGTSGVNAMAHAVEALYAQNRNPITDLMAIEALGTLYHALPVVVAAPGDKDARADALYGAWLCGICLGAVGMALHHKLCHALGGMFDLPHSELHTVILPHALAYNAPAIPEVMARLRDTFGSDDPARALYDLAGRIGAKRALAELGMPESGIDAATDRALANPYWNPRPLERAALRQLIADAYAGNPPSPG